MDPIKEEIIRLSKKWRKFYKKRNYPMTRLEWQLYEMIELLEKMEKEEANDRAKDSDPATGI